MPSYSRFAQFRANGSRRFAVVLIFCLAAMTSANGLNAQKRGIPTIAVWDTIRVIGTSDPNDTSIAEPYRVFRWGNGIVELDAHAPYVRYFNASGARVWTYGRQGHGPGELTGDVVGATITRDKTLVLTDQRNARLLELGVDGALVREVSMAHLGRVGDDIVDVGSAFILTTSTADRANVRVDRKTLRELAVDKLPWPATLPPGLLLSRHNAAAENGDWFSAFFIGPGFFHYSGAKVQFHRFADSIAFRPVRPTPSDTARFAAHWVRAVNGELHVLFGGRPGSMSQKQEFPRRIDVYTPEGVLKRSYLLPIWTVAFDTDGQNYYVVQNDPYPAILILRPRRS